MYILRGSIHGLFLFRLYLKSSRAATKLQNKLNVKVDILPYIASSNNRYTYINRYTDTRECKKQIRKLVPPISGYYEHLLT